MDPSWTVESFINSRMRCLIWFRASDGKKNWNSSLPFGQETLKFLCSSAQVQVSSCFYQKTDMFCPRSSQESSCWRGLLSSTAVIQLCWVCFYTVKLVNACQKNAAILRKNSVFMLNRAIFSCTKKRLWSGQVLIMPCVTISELWTGIMQPTNQCYNL